MARIKVEEMIEKKVNALKEKETKKEAEIKEIRHELKRFKLALDSLRGNR
jgi:chaperonin cofactor prefoldin